MALGFERMALGFEMMALGFERMALGFEMMIDLNAQGIHSQRKEQAVISPHQLIQRGLDCRARHLKSLLYSRALQKPRTEPRPRPIVPRTFLSSMTLSQCR